MCRAHIALQELWAIIMMLYRMAFHLSGKVVILHLDNSMEKAYLCNQGGTVSPFLSWVACQILSLTDSTVLLLFQHTLLPILIWRPIICPRVSCFWSGIFSLRWLKQLFSFGVYQRWICWHTPVPLNASIITPWNLHCHWGLRVECLQPSLDASGKFCVSSSCISSSSSVQVAGRTCQGQLRLLSLVAPCWMVALPTVLNMLADVPQCSPIIKDVIMGVLIGPVLKALPYLHLTL